MGLREACLACALIHVGCLTAELVPCGDLVCPANTVCAVDRCVSQDAFDACVGLADGDPCSATTIEDGTCHGHGCVADLCGDGLIAKNEVCDDGNQRFGDGCSGDCLSNETCGNDVADGLVGEQCDVGLAGLSGDGCTSLCTVEALAWTEVVRQPLPTSTTHPMAYDASRGLVVMFGDTQTWEWNGSSWFLRSPPTPPEAGPYVMAYDAARERIVLFGGFDAGTWLWDGTAWTRATPTSSPPTASGSAMAYDPVRQRIVLFGGYASNELDQTWEWDGASWSEVVPAVRPQKRREHAMVYDATLGKLLMVGGRNGSVTLAETWSWDGSTWALLASAPASFGHCLADDGHGRVLLLDGQSGDLQWNGAIWLAAPGRPTTLTTSSAAYDAARDRVVLYGDRDGGPQIETLLWDGGTGMWSGVSSAVAGVLGPFAYDLRRGTGVATTNGDTYEWHGGRWHIRPAATTPVGGEPGMVYDEARGVTLLFGGNESDQTWEWNGAIWIERQPATRPPQRERPLLVYDRDRARVVMFGGYEFGWLTDTWEWDGTNWSDRAPSPSPGAGAWAAAYDAANKRTVVFGGADAEAETWLWDGTAWALQSPTTSPPPRSGHSLAYDPLRRRVILFGGNDLRDTWEWDGSSWRRLLTAAAPRLSVGAMTFDALSRKLVFTNDAETWTLGYESLDVPGEGCVLGSADTDLDTLAGCSDPDCWARCSPLCPPSTSCDLALPRCGDGTCSPVEDYLICPADCGP